MKLIELEFKQPIEKLIKEGSVRLLGEKLGVSYNSIHLWRMRLGIVFSPECEGCDRVEECGDQCLIAS